VMELLLNSSKMSRRD